MEQQTEVTQESAETQAAEEEAARQSSIGRFADYSQETIKKAASDLGHAAVSSDRVTDARDKLGQASRTFLHQLNIALEDEVESLSKRVTELEERLEALEGKKRATTGAAKGVAGDGKDG